MKSDKVALKTMAIKARVANQIRTRLYKKRLEDFSKDQKAEFFDEVFKLNHDMHWELVFYKSKRRRKADIEQQRIKRGFIKKRKTPKPPDQKRISG